MTTTASPKVKCELCNDTNFIFHEDGSAEICPHHKAELERKYNERLFQSAQIPKRFWGKSLDNFEITRQPYAHKVALDYVTSWPHTDSLFLTGEVGTGKTHLALAILGDLVKKNVNGLAVTVPDLLDELRPSANEEKRAEQMQILKTVSLLILDDLGAQKTTDWVTERLFVILNARYANLLPTVITSNTTLKELVDIPGWPRFVDRISEMARVVKLTGKSYRLKQARRERE